MLNISGFEIQLNGLLRTCFYNQTKFMEATLKMDSVTETQVVLE